VRNYIDFAEAQNEIKRDLAELGVRVHPETMQDKDIADDPDFDTMELYNYIYVVTKPRVEDLEGVHEEWVQQEWYDRLNGGLNPGRAWQLRKDVWEEFLEEHEKGTVGQFSYSYSLRMGGKHIDLLLEELVKHPTSRQLYLPVWGAIDETRRGRRRVPCSLGYHIMNRGGYLHLTYMMRSCDFLTHYPNDVALATLLLKYLSTQSEIPVGTFTHFIGSFHVYQKDVEDVF
jgi:thymidylate synthase